MHQIPTKSLNFILNATEYADEFEQWRDIVWLYTGDSGCCLVIERVRLDTRGSEGIQQRDQIALLVEETAEVKRGRQIQNRFGKRVQELMMN